MGYVTCAEACEYLGGIGDRVPLVVLLPDGTEARVAEVSYATVEAEDACRITKVVIEAVAA